MALNITDKLPEVGFFIPAGVSYMAVGARSVENQQHRFVASGLSTPAGMKNPTHGSYQP